MNVGGETQAALGRYATETVEEASNAEAAIVKAVYTGEKPRFTISTYYTIMSQAFQDKEDAGADFALTESQKIERFCGGLKQNKAIETGIQAVKEMKALPADQQTFQKFYNLFSSDMNAFITATQTQETRFVRNTNNTNQNSPPGRGSFGFHPYSRGGRGSGGRSNNRGGRNTGRGRFGGRNSGRGGRSSGRFGYNRNFPGGAPSFASLPSFEPELKKYSPEEWCNFTPEQKHATSMKKKFAGWLNDVTPPVGQMIDANTGYPVPDLNHQSNVTRVNNANFQYGQPTNIITDNASQGTPFLPPRVNNSEVGPPNTVGFAPGTAGQAFAPRRNNQGNDDDSTIRSVSSVTINGAPYTGAIFDQNGNRLN